MLEARPPSGAGLPQLPGSPFDMPCPLPRWTETGAPVGCFPVPRGPSPLLRRVGVHNFTFEACSGFTHITACRIAQPPKAAFVTRLRSARLPDQIARQLPGPTDNFLGGTFLHWSTAPLGRTEKSGLEKVKAKSAVVVQPSDMWISGAAKSCLPVKQPIYCAGVAIYTKLVWFSV